MPESKKRKTDGSIAGIADENNVQIQSDEDGASDDLNDSQNEETYHRNEPGPKFHINERVLVLDSTRSPQTSSTEHNQPPLYEATIKQSGLRHVDPATKEVLSETKFAFSKKRGRRRHNHAQQQHALHDQEKEWCYLIHFLGWNSRHDRWMTEADVFPNTEKNRARLEGNSPKVARAVKTEAPMEKKKKMGRPKKVEDGIDKDNCDINKLIEACELPFTLKRILVDDHDKITKVIYPPSGLFPRDGAGVYNKGITMLHKLPSTMNVQSILATFLEAKKKDDLEEFVKERDKSLGDAEGSSDSQLQQQQQTADDGVDREKETKEGSAETSAPNESTKQSTNEEPSSQIITKDVLKLRKKKRKQTALSILELFDASLSKLLLYRKESEQYTKEISDDKDTSSEANEDSNPAKRPSQIYGGEHLLRLFVKLPELLATSRTISVIQGEIDDAAKFLSQFVVFLQKNRADCFKERYFAVYRDGHETPCRVNPR